MDEQGPIDPTGTVPPAQSSATPPVAQQPAPPLYAPPAPGPAPYAAPAPRSTSAAWKWVLGILAVLVLGAIACCGVSFSALSGGSWGGEIAGGDAVALIHIDGVIAGTGSAIDGVITPEDVLDKLDQALADDSVKAILLRIDSPGGTVAASQEIATEVARAAEEKPVVASIGDVGASGAYMVASQCDEIIASPTSAVGSIGVITEIPNVAGLLDKLGIQFTVLTAGKYKDAGSPYRSLTTTETDLIQHEVDVAYEEFIKIVAEGRGLSEDKVREMATGWAWSAREAKGMGLVDTLGTYNDAVDRAAELGGIDGEPNIVTYDSTGYGDLLIYLLGVKDSLDRLGALAPKLTSPGPAVPK